ncbi:hypothetical protein D3C83_100950 [compost metagenome]
MQHRFLHWRRQFVECGLEVETIVRGETLQHLEIELVAPVPAFDRARGKRQIRKGDDPPRIEKTDRAQPVAARARAHRVVERKKPRLELRQ